ncbi:MAG: thermonuclease family protein [Candidatus Pacearchaeota archaeon]
MKKLMLILLLLIFFTSGCITQQTTKQEEKTTLEKAIVTKIIDGDTIVIQGGKHVRLLGIDAPEKGKPYYFEAKNYLESKLYLKEVLLESDVENEDQYGRLLRWVWFNDSLINAELVENGLAIASFYKDMKYQQAIIEAEKFASENKIGLWSLSKSNADACVALGCPEGTVFVASKNSKKYHRCNCEWAKKIKPENLLCFKSKEEAEKNHEPCSSCNF